MYSGENFPRWGNDSKGGQLPSERRTSNDWVLSYKEYQRTCPLEDQALSSITEACRHVPFETLLSQADPTEGQRDPISYHVVGEGEDEAREGSDGEQQLR